MMMLKYEGTSLVDTNVSNLGIIYLFVICDLSAISMKSCFPNIAALKQINYICILLITTFCVHNFPLILLGPYSCQCQYSLKYDICIYHDIWPDKPRSYGQI